MKEIIKKITATRGYKVAEAVVLFPVQVIVIAVAYGFALPMILIGEKIEATAGKWRQA